MTIFPKDKFRNPIFLSTFAKQKQLNMISSQDIIQVRDYARQDGVFLALLWTAGFIATMYANTDAALGLIGNLATLATPFFVAYRLKAFRNDALEGHISFRRGLFYCMKTFFHGAVLLTVVQFLWFRYGNVSGFMTQWQASYEAVIAAYQMSAAEARQLKEAVAMMSPLAWASLFLIMEIIAGLVLSPIIAAIMQRKK